jgi:hypothetical protein
VEGGEPGLWLAAELGQEKGVVGCADGEGGEGRRGSWPKRRKGEVFHFAILIEREKEKRILPFI